MSTYEKTFLDNVVESGQRNCIIVPWPHRGNINKLVVTQEDGAGDGFDINLYNSRLACPDVEFPSSSSSSAGETPPAEIFKVLPTQTTAGKVMEWFGDQAYENQDPGTGSTIVSKKLYLEIIPAGSGPKTFSFSMAQSHPGI